MMPVPAELVDVLMPWLPNFKQQVQDMGKAAGPSRRSVLESCEYLANVVVQDAMELCDAHPTHPVHALLLGHQRFR